MLPCDVAVVGGGPGGVAAAITLARAGRDVVLIDQATFPRDKTCGDGLTANALRRYEALGLRPESIPSWTPVREVVVRSPSGRTILFPLPRDGLFAAVARRSELDAAFADVARAAGVKVHDGHAVRGLIGRGDRVDLEVEGIGSVTARYVVAADGAWSRVRKLTGREDEPGYLGEWHALRQYHSGVGEQAERELWVWFEPDLLPGYVWSFPAGNGTANVGFGLLRRPGMRTGQMGALWRDVLDRPHIRSVIGTEAVTEGPPRAWPIPARVSRTALTAAAGRVLFVGDAARAADSMTGEGIGQALETGEEAAEAIVTAGPWAPARAAALYEATVRRTLVVDDALARLLGRALSHRKGARAAVRVAGVSNWTRRNFARWLFEDYPRATVVTPGRWHRQVFTGPGAYRD